MGKKQVITVSILVLLLVGTIIGGFFIHLYVFPRTNVFKEAGIPANEAVTIEVQKNGYSDVNSVTDETSKDFILEKLSDLRITKAYRYEHNETDSPPSYIYTFHTKESERFFSVRFYDSGEKIDIIKYNAETKKLIGFEYTVESFRKDDLEFFQTLIPAEYWKTPGPQATPLDRLSSSAAKSPSPAKPPEAGDFATASK